MATLCATYLTFECFGSLKESELQPLVSQGAYAFQEYATLNWIYHSDLVLNLYTACDSESLAGLKQSCHKLLSREMLRQLRETNLERNQENLQDIRSALTRFQSLNESVHSISSNAGGASNLLSKIVDGDAANNRVRLNTLPISAPLPR